MAEVFDVIIAGLGAFGSAAAYHLARRGHLVLGLDRFTPPHTGGSHHGRTRMIREAYFEHPGYVPIVQRAYESWRELEREAGQPLLRLTGGLMVGVPDGLLVPGARQSAKLHKLPYEEFPPAELQRRFPALRPAEGMQALFEPGAGILFPEACVRAHLEGARKAGADLRFEEAVTRWEAEGKGIRVDTPKGSYRAGNLILAAGAWLAPLVPDLALPLAVERQVVYWFEPATPAEFTPERCPVFIIEHARERYLYGFPELGDGVKIALHHEGEMTDPEHVRREVGGEETASIRALLRRFVPGADGTLRDASVCLYTNTPDGHFIVDFHPAHPQLLLASPCSGHGFKFAGVLGEAAAGLLSEGRPTFDLSMFRLDRLA